MYPTRLILAIGVAALAAAGARAAEQLPPGAKVVGLEAHPAAIELKTPYAYAQLLITAQLESGEAVDATRIAKVEAPAALLKVSDTGLVRPAADGSGAVKVSLAGQSLEIPVTVSGQSAPYAVSFVRDVMPVMSKMGCNAGTCHGSAGGKNGFKLSLRGYDPAFDHLALTDDVSGRRFNRSAPDRSLMLLKATGEVPHVGGVLTRPGEPGYRILHDWIAQGVKLDLGAPRVRRIEVFPKGPVVPVIGMRQQMAVIAEYADGSVRDVSAEAFVESSNTEVAKVDAGGLVTTVRRGEATMLARYEGAYAASTVVVMGDRSGFAWRDVPAYNYIDELVYEKLKKVKVLPSDVCTDAEFIRRAYLDLTGLPPGPEEVRAFLEDARPQREKRDALVDRLVGSPEFVDHWTNKWADLLQVNRKFLGVQGAQALREYVRKAVADNMPYDKFCYEVLTGSGSTVENPTAGYFKVLRTPEDAMENTTQLFLAIRFNCNKCHDHPFERWNQDQYYQLAAFFAQVDRKEDPKYKGQKLGGTAVEKPLPAVEIISDVNKGEVTHARTGEVAAPEFPYEFGLELDPKAARRERLARWVTSKDNPYFAKSYANRVWSYLLGVGLIEPVDDIRAGNPPSNPKLLDALTKDFVENGFDVQRLIKTICKSRTYQLSIHTNKWNENDTINYSHAVARRLPAEVLYDAIHRATGSQSKLPGLPAGARAAQLLDSNVELPGGFLELFGKPPRESACECERSDGVMLGPILAMVNGPVLAEAIKDPNNRIARLAAANMDDDRLVEELFLAVLNRFPTAAERAAAKEALRGATGDFEAMVADHRRRQEAFQDYERQVDARQAAWEKELAQQPTWTVLDPEKMTAKGGSTFAKRDDKSVFVSGPNPTPEIYTVTAKTDLKGVTAVRLEVLPDDALPAKGPGRAPNGNFVLNELKLRVAPADKPKEAKQVSLHKAVATFSQDSWAVAGAIDGNNQSGWAVSPKFGQAHSALFELKEPVNFPAGAVLTFVMEQRFPGKEHTIGRFRLAVTTDQKPRLKDGTDPAIAKILAIPPEQRTPQQKAELARRHREQDANYRRLRAEAAETPPASARVLGAQDVVWALMNSPAFMFNH